MKLKVMFVQGGLPSYFKFLLNRLNEVEGLEVADIIPLGKGQTLGSGVKEDQQGARFAIYALQEYKTWYGKSFFRNFEQTLINAGSEIVLMGWPYMMQLAFNPFLWWRLKKRGVKFIHRDIPFNTPVFGKAVSYYNQDLNRQEDMRGRKKSWLGLAAFVTLTRVRKFYLKLADAHLYYTDEAREVIGSYGISQDKIFISANSPDTDILLGTYYKIKETARILPVNPFRLIHVGRLVRWKRVDLIIDAIAGLKAQFPEIELLIAGFGPEEAALKQQVKDRGLERHISFLGGIYDPAVLGKYLYESSVYVLAGMGGLSINDAMCFARPVICSEADGTEKRLVREGFNGYYFENGNLSDLQAKIGLLLADPEKAALFGARSLAIIENEVNIHTVISECISAFNYVTSNRYKLGSKAASSTISI